MVESVQDEEFGDTIASWMIKRCWDFLRLVFIPIAAVTADSLINSILFNSVPCFAHLPPTEIYIVFPSWYDVL